MQNAKTTVNGREKLVRAHVGEDSLPPITEIGFGTGGSTGGEPDTPTGSETVVPGEVLRKPIEGYTFTGATTVEIDGLLDFEEGNGETYSSAGLYDSDGDLVAILFHTPRPKSDDTRFVVTWTETF